MRRTKASNLDGEALSTRSLSPSLARSLALLISDGFFSLGMRLRNRATSASEHVTQRRLHHWNATKCSQRIR